MPLRSLGSMKPFTLQLTALLLLFASAQSNADEASLRVTPTTPAISITLREHDRLAIELPELQYEFQVEARCAPGLAPDSMMLSVADTRKRVAISDTQPASDSGISMSIPAAQIAPLSVEGFCVNARDRERSPQESVTVRGVLSAQASLVCSDEDGQQITYASQSLDVTLACEEEPPE